MNSFEKYHLNNRLDLLDKQIAFIKKEIKKNPKNEFYKVILKQLTEEFEALEGKKE